MDDSLAEGLQSGDARDFVRAARNQEGFKPLRHSAIELAAEGITTVEQVLRATFGVEDY